MVRDFSFSLDLILFYLLFSLVVGLFECVKFIICQSDFENQSPAGETASFRPFF